MPCASSKTIAHMSRSRARVDRACARVDRACARGALQHADVSGPQLTTGGADGDDCARTRTALEAVFRERLPAIIDDTVQCYHRMGPSPSSLGDTHSFHIATCLQDARPKMVVAFSFRVTSGLGDAPVTFGSMAWDEDAREWAIGACELERVQRWASSPSPAMADLYYDDLLARAHVRVSDADMWAISDAAVVVK